MFCSVHVTEGWSKLLNIWRNVGVCACVIVLQIVDFHSLFWSIVSFINLLEYFLGTYLIYFQWSLSLHQIMLFYIPTFYLAQTFFPDLTLIHSLLVLLTHINSIASSLTHFYIPTIAIRNAYSCPSLDTMMWATVSAVLCSSCSVFLLLRCSVVNLHLFPDSQHKCGPAENESSALIFFLACSVLISIATLVGVFRLNILVPFFLHIMGTYVARGMPCILLSSDCLNLFCISNSALCFLFHSFGYELRWRKVCKC